MRGLIEIHTHASSRCTHTVRAHRLHAGAADSRAAHQPALCTDRTCDGTEIQIHRPPDQPATTPSETRRVRTQLLTYSKFQLQIRAPRESITADTPPLLAAPASAPSSTHQLLPAAAVAGDTGTDGDPRLRAEHEGLTGNDGLIVLRYRGVRGGRGQKKKQLEVAAANTECSDGIGFTPTRCLTQT